MQSLWNESEARAVAGDAVATRAYTSRLIGREPSLVLHGGGNTSVKCEKQNLFGESEKLIFVKGSGFDLATIEPRGFAPVRLETLLKMARLESLDDEAMLSGQRAAMTDASAPNPTVEAILHAVIPFRYVDHTHADAVLALANTPDGKAKLARVYGSRVLILPYEMPGFRLARQVFVATRDLDWKKTEGILLLHHGLFTFADDARESYERMIRLVTEAEEEIKRLGAWGSVRLSGADSAPHVETTREATLALASLRQGVSKRMGRPAIARWNRSAEAVAFSASSSAREIVERGPLTPDHLIHTKRTPVFLSGALAGGTEEPNKGGAFGGSAAQPGSATPGGAVAHPQFEADLSRFEREYREYFERNRREGLAMLDPAPRWAVWPGKGILAFGETAKRADIVADISRHTLRAIEWAEALGGWRALDERSLFEVEYWRREQMKLERAGLARGSLAGKIALVTGGASGIGKACVEELRAEGACVAVLDLHPETHARFRGADLHGIVCDVTDARALGRAIDECVGRFGGLDVVVANAGSFPPGRNIADLEPDAWRKAIEINLTSHFLLFHETAPFLKKGFDPAIVVVASKNVPAPGPGASAYSSAKAGLTQLARVAALEMGQDGIRVNVLHPNAVFDTGIWTPEVLANRARHYGMTVEQYKTNNVLRAEVTSRDVARLACTMAGPVFARTTGAQVPVDGGNDRVI